jgi:Spy/CpxP family protein refolding chaperone
MNSPITMTRSRGPLRLLLATAVLALAGGLSQTVSAMPHGPGGHGMGPMAMGGPGGGPDGVMMGGARMERMLDSIGASAEQKAQMRQIMQAAMTDLQGQRDARLKLHDQMRALFAQPTVDANALEALRQQQQALHEQASKRMTQAMLDASRVLSAEQRKQLAERMAQRREMMQRHRAERQSIEGGAPRRP